MPKLTSKIPEKIRPYLFYGVDLDWAEGDENAVGDCPWCFSEGKFSVLVETGQCKCWVCGSGSDKGGTNTLGFLRLLHEDSLKETRYYEKLAAHRKLLDPRTLEKWQVCQSKISNDWLVPGFGADGKLNQLYKYAKKLYAGPKPLTQQLFGVNFFDNTKPVVYLCEGPWDAMVLWELLGSTKETDDGYKRTSDINKSMLATSNVLAVPGCNTFRPEWAKLFNEKTVCLLFDSDHPKAKTEKTKELPPAGFAGMKRVAGLISAHGNPDSIHYLNWGEKGFDPELPTNTDIRDILSEGTTLTKRAKLLNPLFNKLVPIPEDWEKEAEKETKLDCKTCNKFSVLQSSWRKALKWTDALEGALIVMLASVISTKTNGDQLWLKVLGSPSCGKSTLCEAISVATRYVIPKSTIRGFHSGYVPKGGDTTKDSSLITQIIDMTLVTKDGDTLLQAPNLGQILSEARDIYDRTSRSHYRNEMGKEYSGINMTWLLCGTNALRAIDSSELGQRFLDYVIMDDIDDDLEDEIGWIAVNKAFSSVSVESNGKPTSQQDPEMTLAMQLSGGYVSYLRENAVKILDDVHGDESVLRKCMALGKFVAHMRARPSRVSAETEGRELATRLQKQLTRLACCIAAVMNKKEIDKEVMLRVTKVALDTSRGQTLEIVHYIQDRIADRGVEVREIGIKNHMSEHKARRLLSFLQRIRVVESFKIKPEKGSKIRHTQTKWKLTEKMSKLYKDIME